MSPQMVWQRLNFSLTITCMFISKELKELTEIRQPEIRTSNACHLVGKSSS